MACDANKLKAALFEQSKEVRQFVNEQIEAGDRMALRMVPDKGFVEPNSNQDVVIFGTARQASIGYKSVDSSARALIAGTMNGRGLDATKTEFDTDINSIDDNACHGSCILDFAQGFRRRGTNDFKLSVTSQEICTEELDRMDRALVAGYFKGLKTNFTRWGFDNFNDELINRLLISSEANTSVIAANQFSLTTGGFQAPPVYRLSIWHLQQWKRAIRQAKHGLGMNPPVDWLFEIEAPVEDWIDAVRADQIARNPTGTVYDIKYLEDAEGPMRGRKYDVYGGIKCYFNEAPIRGIFKQTAISGGSPVYSFVRVLDWKNVPGELGGLVMTNNPDYDNDSIIVDGVTYNMVTLIPHIDPKSFQRYGLVKSLKPEGGANSGTNFTVKVLDGAHIPCNDHNDKFKLVARHRFRFRSKYPEISGFLAYRHGRRAGYTLAVTPLDLVPGTTAFAGPQVFDACNPDGCETATCGSCGQVPNASGQCVDEGAAPHGTLNLNPCGALSSVFYGEAMDVTLKVHRTGDPSSYASVLWASAHSTTTDTDFLDTSANLLEWEPGDTTPKEIVIPILATADGGIFTVTISGATGDAIGTCSVATITLTDES